MAGPKSKCRPGSCAAEGMITLSLSLDRRLFGDGDICRDSPCQGEQQREHEGRKLWRCKSSLPYLRDLPRKIKEH